MFIRYSLIALVFATVHSAIVPVENLPLRTEGADILDATGNPIRLTCVAWFAAHMERFVVDGLDLVDVDILSQNITNLGFNCVRLTFSAEMYYRNPVVNTSAVLANPQFYDKTAMEVFDATIKSLTDAGQMIILNSHTSDAKWCCNPDDENGLWHNPRYPTEMWQKQWTDFAARYKDNKLVIASDLRNEIRRDTINHNYPVWGFGGDNDWHAAATNAGNAILAVNPDQLIIVEGLMYAFLLEQIRWLPIEFDIPNRLVYSFHIYDHSPVEWKITNQFTFDWFMNKSVAFMRQEGKKYTAPVWIGEFGTDHDNKFWKLIIRYLERNNNIHWSYWAYNGYKGTPEVDQSGGILNPDFLTIRAAYRIDALQRIMDY